MLLFKIYPTSRNYEPASMQNPHFHSAKKQALTWSLSLYAHDISGTFDILLKLFDFS